MCEKLAIVISKRSLISVDYTPRCKSRVLKARDWTQFYSLDSCHLSLISEVLTACLEHTVDFLCNCFLWSGLQACSELWLRCSPQMLIFL